MIRSATSAELTDAITEHLEVTVGHVARLEEIFGLLGKKPQAKRCAAMEGLTKEGEETIEATMDGSATRDVGIIMASQKVEHYEISAYGSMARIATVLGLTEVAELLEQTLAEEKEADEKLTTIAESSINNEAAQKA